MKDRTDAKKNKAKVIKEVVKNPLLSQREIAEKAKVGLGTVNRNMQKLEQIGTKDDRILGICNTDLEIVTLGQKEIERRLKDKEELDKMKTGEISQVIRENTARYTIFKGDITNKDGGMKNEISLDFSKKTIKELENIRNDLLK